MWARRAAASKACRQTVTPLWFGLHEEGEGRPLTSTPLYNKRFSPDECLTHRIVNAVGDYMILHHLLAVTLSTDVAVIHGRASTLGHAMGGCSGQRSGRGKHTRGVAPGPTTERVAKVEIVSQSPVQALKNHLRLIRGSTILDDIGTRILGGRLIRWSDLYASIYGMHRVP